jgi:hypothetical protein
MSLKTMKSIRVCKKSTAQTATSFKRNRLSRANLNAATLITRVQNSLLNFVKNGLAESFEKGVDIKASLGGSLYEEHAMLFGQRLSLLCAYLAAG